MIAKSKLALAALIISAVASPAFAEQLGVGADPVTDGRYYPGFETTYRPAPPAKIFSRWGISMQEEAQNARLAVGNH